MISIRDASYTTQPLELLNNLGFENTKHHKVLTRDLDSPSRVPAGSYLSNHNDTVYENGSIVGREASANGISLDPNQEIVRSMDMEGSEGLHIEMLILFFLGEYVQLP